MPLIPMLCRPMLAIALSLLSFAASAQRDGAAPLPYVPEVGQAGKDVVWVPTPDRLVERMLELGRVTAGDVLIDLGSGDGRTVVAAAQRGASALGIELNPDLVKLARERARREGVTDRARFEQQDLFDTDLSPASVITMFLLNELNLRLRPRLLALKPGTRIVSNTFTMGDWEADETATLPPSVCAGGWCTALLWIVPAQVAGTYRVDGGELTLAQTYQKLSGTLRAGGETVRVEGRVRGEEVSLRAGRRMLRGRVTGSGIEWR
jgi:SAM-dependent methyltransferase